MTLVPSHQQLSNGNNIKINYLTIMKYFLSLLFISVSMSFFSQKREIIDGKEYIVHTVKQGETLYGITQKYSATKKDLRDANSGILMFLKEGQKLNIPVAVKDRTIHTVEKGETLYGISKIYGLTIEELTALNPEKVKDLQVGTVLQLRKKAKTIPEPKEESATDKTVHVVAKGETLYGITKKYGVTLEQLKKLNPGLTENIAIGDKIVLPVGAKLMEIELPKTENFPKSGSKLIQYTVEKGETFYGISKKYNTTVEAIKKSNPGVESLKEGDKLTIALPSKYLTDIKVSLGEPILPKGVNLDSVNKINPLKDELNKMVMKESYSVSLFLPLMLDKNAQIPMETNKVKKIHPYTEMSTHFYQGVRLALDSVAKSGTSFDLQVFDTRNDTSTVGKQLKTNTIKTSDLIVGPFFEKPYKLVSDFSKTQQIQAICPVNQSNKLLFNNPFVTELKTSFPTQISYVANFIAKNRNTENVICVSGKTKQEKYLANLFIENFEKALVGKPNNYRTKASAFNLTSYSSMNGFDAKLVKGKKNVVVLPIIEKGMASSFFTQLNIILSKSRMKGYEVEIYALENFLEYDDIETSYKMKYNLHVTTSSFIDYKDENVVTFVKQYRAKFGSEPSKFAFMGFDAAFFHAVGLDAFGKGYSAHYDQIKVPLLQSSFQLERSDKNSGFENQSVFIVAYKDFELIKVN